MYFWPKNGQNDQTNNFPDTTLPLDDTKQLSPVSDQVLDKSGVWFRRKCPKTWFLSKNGQILDQKRSKNVQKIFLSQPKFTFLVLNHKLGLTSTPSDGPPRQPTMAATMNNLHEIPMNSY